ncbi:MAG: RNA methyltransferase [Bacteroidetes bacterium]|nr:MAG: RNA methyltransferase [Bacteroidota bacterium]
MSEEQNSKFRMIAKTYEGLEEVLIKELEDLGASDIKALRRAVEFYGDLKMMYKANYWLRTAVSVLKPIAAFEVENEKDLYDKIYAIKWYNHFDLGKTFAVQATVNNHETLTHSQYAALKVKDAIADQFRYNFNQRPDVDPKNANININVYISGKQCEVALNSSGMPLFKRGYKVEMHRAPLNEVLAAGMILLAGWDKNSNFIDPMCGSGTLLIEAALMAYNFPPQFMRRNFNFQYWADFDPTIWREIKAEDLKLQRDFEYRIIGGDISSKNLEIARHLITHMKFHKDIDLVQADIRDHKAPDDGNKGWIVTNPPYGERLHSKDLLGLYEKIGTAFKHNFPGYTAALISSDVEAMKMIGLKPIKKRELYNGGLLCKFNTYDLYEGSKKEKKQTQESSVEDDKSLAVEIDESQDVNITNLFNDGSEMKDYDPLAHAKELEEKAARWEKEKQERKERWEKNKNQERERKRDDKRAKREDRGAYESREERGEWKSRDEDSGRGAYKKRDQRSSERGGKREFKRELGKDHYNTRGKGERPSRGRQSGENEQSDWKQKRYERLKKQREESEAKPRSNKGYGETKGDDWKSKRFDRFKKRKDDEDIKKGSGDWKSKRRDDFKKEHGKDGSRGSKPGEGRRSSFKRGRIEDGEKDWGKKSSRGASSRRDRFKKKGDDKDVDTNPNRSGRKGR